jgi:hypothetical protein
VRWVLGEMGLMVLGVNVSGLKGRRDGKEVGV